jgi:hypothetical protein
MTKTTTRIRDVMCPDGQKRTFYLNDRNPGDHSVRGYVQVNHSSVAGYARKTHGGWQFYPHIDGVNIHLVRPAPLELNTYVTIRATDLVGVIREVSWNYLTPSYRVYVPRTLSYVTVTGTENLEPLEQ